MTFKNGLSLGLMLVLTARAGPREILWNQTAGSAISRGVLISEADFLDEQLVEIANSALREKRGVFLHLAILTSHRQRTTFSTVSDVSMGFWRERCMAVASASAKMAELVSIGSDAVLRIRDGLKIRYIGLAGADPLHLRSGGNEFTITHVALNPGSISRFAIYAQGTNGVSVPAAEQLMQDLRRRLEEPSVYLVLRKDPWFWVAGRIAPCWWAVGATMPDVDTIDRAPEIRCPRLDSAELSCEAYGLR